MTASFNVAKKKNTWLLPLLLGLMCLAAIGAGLYLLYATARTEEVAVWARPVAAGQQVTAADVTTIALPIARPDTLPVVREPQALVGMWTTRAVGKDELVAPEAVQRDAPTVPFYPSGKTLPDGMVAVPFSLATVGPVTERDRINVNVIDRSGDPSTCTAGTALETPSTTEAVADFPDSASSLSANGEPLPVTCRLVPQLDVLYVDTAAQVAYLAATPYQAQAIYTMSAAPNTQLYGERYGTTSPALPYLTKLDPASLNAELLTGPVSATTPLLPGIHAGVPGTIPAATTSEEGN